MNTNRIVTIPGWPEAEKTFTAAMNRRRRLGVKLHPQAVTDAWYAADCPPKLDVSMLSRHVQAQWWLSRKLRGLS